MAFSAIPLIGWLWQTPLHPKDLNKRFFIIELDHIREISQIVIGIHLVNIDHRFSYHMFVVI